MTDTAGIPRAQRPRAPHRRSFAGGRAVFALMLREMATSYGRSPGGYIWAVAEPVAGIAFMTVIFSLFFASPPLGNSFALFYATGMMPFTIFTDMQGKTAGALNYSRQLLAYPTVTFLDALLARFVLTLITQLLICYLVFGGAVLLFEGPVRTDLWPVLAGLLLSALLGFAIGSVNCYIFMKIPVWQLAWSVLMRPMFVISGIFMVFDSVPQPYRDWLWWNPLVHVIGMLRRGFYESYRADYASPAYVSLLSLGLLAIGLLLLRRHHRDLLERN